MRFSRSSPSGMAFGFSTVALPSRAHRFGWVSSGPPLGLKSPEEAAEYANRILDAAMAAENFVYNGYVVDYDGGDQ